jgi:hypothetical protein
MIKVFSNRKLAFNRGEKDSKGNLVRVIAPVGFGELPDWVENDSYFQLALKDGTIKQYTSTAESKQIETESEKLSALRAEVAELEAKKLALSQKEPSVIENPVDTPEKSSKKAKAKAEKSQQKAKSKTEEDKEDSVTTQEPETGEGKEQGRCYKWPMG